MSILTIQIVESFRIFIVCLKIISFEGPSNEKEKNLLRSLLTKMLFLLKKVFLMDIQAKNRCLLNQFSEAKFKDFLRNF